jgi:hypothetical protein
MTATLRNIINDTASARDFLPNRIADAAGLHTDLDGSAARAFLEAAGFNVIDNRDTGRNGLATTACGIKLSTNGYCYR